MLQLGRLHAEAVLSALTSVLNALAPLRAPKRVVLVSAGLPYDQQLLSRFNDLVEKAAQAHVAVSVLHLDQPGFDASSRGLEASVGGGREYATGLANIASATGGEFFMGVGGAQGALDRIAASIEVFYQLGVESQPSDADGKTHRIEVKLARAGLKARAPAQTAVAPSSRQSGDAIRRALSQPTDLADVPLEVAPYVTHSTDRGKVRLVIAAQIASDIVPADWGYVFVKDGKELPGEQIHVASGEQTPWTATAAVDLDPGRYRLRTAVVVADGRVAVLEIPVVAALRSAEPLSTGDLMIGTVGDGKLQPRAAVRQDERAVGMIELSSSEPLGDTTGALLITRGGTTQPALRVPLSLRTRADDRSIVVAESPLDLSSLASGPYTASAVLTRAGKPIAQVNRVFDIAPGASGASPSPAAPAASTPVHPRDPALDEMMMLVGRYVTDYAQETSLIVGVEHYDQRLLNAAQAQVQRRVTVAEFALVRTSDAIGWSGFRDVTEVDGKRIANHGARLQALFHGGSADLAEARRIADESAKYNIGATTRNFNEPTSVLFFFTPQTQARFALTRRGDQTIDGRTVWEIDFNETARPTLIRTSNGHDVPAQGTIWVNPSDGAVVRTRLLLTGFAGIGSKTDVDVSYVLDSHLQIWLPAAMHERDDLELTSQANSGGMFGGFSARQRTSVVGTATYTDFKRFQTSGAVKIKK
jgi:hypothetical protein